MLGQQEIPARVVEADGEDCMVMSLVENLARRQHRAVNLLYNIEGLNQRGYDDSEIAPEQSSWSLTASSVRRSSCRGRQDDDAS